MTTKQYCLSPQLNEAISETASRMNGDEPDEIVSAPVDVSMLLNVPRVVEHEVQTHRPAREVIPGVFVSEAAIREATSYAPPCAVELAKNNIKGYEELAEDLKISKEVVQAMLERARTPLNMKEKYVKFDTMPKPLKRLIEAYMAVETANEELEAAVKALGSELIPEVVKT